MLGFDSDLLLSLARLFLIGELSPAQLCQFFPLLSDYVAALRAQVTQTLSQVQVVVGGGSHDFEEQPFLDSIQVERLRFKKLWVCQPVERPRIARIAPRFLRFPIAGADSGTWTVREGDDFAPMNLPPVPTRPTIVDSIPCEHVTSYGHNSAACSVLSGELRISRAGRAAISLPFESIYLLMSLRPGFLEIFIAACKSHLLQFNGDSYSRVVDALTSQGLKIHSDSTGGRDELLRLWARRRVSNFELAIGLSLLSGRSFNDLLCYPVLPAVHNNRLLSPFLPVAPAALAVGVTRWLLSLGLFPGRPSPPLPFEEFMEGAAREFGCVPPQAYFAFSSFTADSHAALYSARRSFDSEPAIEIPLLEWITARFAVDIPLKHPPPKQLEAATQCTIANCQIVAADFIGFGVDFFFVLCEDGAFQVLGVNPIVPATIVTVRTFAKPLALSDTAFICALRTMVLIVDVKMSTVFRVSDVGESVFFWHSSMITLAAPMGNTLVYVVDWNLVVLSPAQAFPTKKRTIAVEEDRITQLQANAGFSAVVYVTEKGKMAIVGTRTGRLLGEVFIRNEIVEKLLMTDAWGFVIVKTNKNCYTYTLSGTQIGRCEFPNVILAWTAYTVGGSDAVLLVDGELQVMRFEAFRPDQLEVLKRTKKVVVALRVNRHKDTVILITSDGKVVFMPLPPLVFK
jgi:hypothetical protein